jgi:flavin reductase (DIM6/NTAB) family NADH-FMN oxidoreductase RutF
MTITFDPSSTPVPTFHELLLGAVAPRPIAFVSTVDANGNVNLAPFSFFNAFSANPPILVFSPARSGRTGQTKHTHDNVLAVPECVVNIVTYDMVRQVSLASSDYPREVNEFEKAGFTSEPSTIVKPPRVRESPAQFECKVNQVIALGEGGAAGNLVVCEVLLAHVSERILDAAGRIDPFKMDHVARMGRNFYARVAPEAIFELPKLHGTDQLGIGFDRLPEPIRASHVLTGNELAQLAALPALPTPDDIQAAAPLPDGQDAEEIAKQLIAAGQPMRALAVLMASLVSQHLAHGEA